MLLPFPFFSHKWKFHCFKLEPVFRHGQVVHGPMVPLNIRQLCSSLAAWSDLATCHLLLIIALEWEEQVESKICFTATVGHVHQPPPPHPVSSIFFLNQPSKLVHQIFLWSNNKCLQYRRWNKPTPWLNMFYSNLTSQKSPNYKLTNLTTGFFILVWLFISFTNPSIKKVANILQQKQSMKSFRCEA